MKKKNKNKSLVSQTIHMFVIQSALLGIVIVTYICVSYYTVLENMQTSSRNHRSEKDHCSYRKNRTA